MTDGDVGVTSPVNQSCLFSTNSDAIDLRGRSSDLLADLFSPSTLYLCLSRSPLKILDLLCLEISLGVVLLRLILTDNLRRF